MGLGTDKKDLLHRGQPLFHRVDKGPVFLINDKESAIGIVYFIGQFLALKPGVKGYDHGPQLHQGKKA